MDAGEKIQLPGPFHDMPGAVWFWIIRGQLLWLYHEASDSKGSVQRAVSHFFPYKKRIVLRSGFSGNGSVVRAYFLISFLCFRISPEPEKEISYMRFPHIDAAPDL